LQHDIENLMACAENTAPLFVNKKKGLPYSGGWHCYLRARRRI